ncbi:glycosyltransferase [Polluticaenibacter yanchengensis]|uniref:Glycosyltransferase n=1 Tax=Polluticaenibacter yanchengensis TaxID=3014562 RepID=A0ABT4UNM1_9BACT|nr:glycosyltransferase [Chitinophagaceae bacterium LY-5]
MHILILCPHPISISPSTRFRVNHYITQNSNTNIHFHVHPFIDIDTWNILYEPGHQLKKAMGILKGFFKRFKVILGLSKYDYVYIHREAAPVGFPVFEWLIARVFKKKIIYDFDDSIWVRNNSAANPIALFLKAPWKVKYICKWSYKVSVGNEYLANYVRQYNTNVQIIPTVVDTDNLHNRIHEHLPGNLPTIGWTGTFTNHHFLEQLTPVIQNLKKKYHFNFLIISNKNPNLKAVEYSFIKWDMATEMEDLNKIDIGLMPIDDSEVAKGKCAFKAIQYMALGIPAVVSNISANATVVTNNSDGYLCRTSQEWEQALESLLIDVEHRQKMGVQARRKIVDQFSVTATIQSFYDLFK